MSGQPDQKDREELLQRKIRELEEELEEQQQFKKNDEKDDRETERLKKRREWLRSLSQEDRDTIATYGFNYWEKLTGKKRDGK